MANIAKLNVILVASSGPFTKGLKKARTGLNSFSKRVKSSAALMGGPLLSAGKLMATWFKRIAIAGIAAGGALAYITKQTAETIDAQGKLARRLGYTFAQFKGLSLAASLAGVSQENMNKVLEKMADTLGAASFGEGSAIRALEQIGLNVDYILSLSPAEQFRAIGAAIAALPDPNQRIAAAKDIFGRSGAEAITLFEGGAAALDYAAEKVMQFGLALSELDVSAIEAMNDSLTRVQSIFEGIASQIAAGVSPYVTQIATDFEDWVISLGGVPSIMEEVGSAAAYALDKIAGYFDKFASILGIVYDIGSTLDAIANKLPGIKQIRSIVLEGKVGNFNIPGLGGGISGEIDKRTEDRKQQRGSTYQESFRSFADRARTNADNRALDAQNAPSVQAARERGLAERRAIYDQQFGGASIQDMGYNQEQLNLLRQIALNTGANNIAWAQ